MVQLSHLYLSLGGKNSAGGKLIDEKGLIRIGHLCGLQVDGWESAAPKNLVGYSFIIKGKIGRGKRPLSSSPLSSHHTSINSSSRLGREVFLSRCGRAKKYYFRSLYNE